MSIFFFISGYLINIQKLVKENLHSLLNLYLYRLIIPWVIALLIYSYIQYGKDIINNTFIMFYNPYYHLWYIPAFLSYIAFTLLLFKLKINVRTILITLIPISLFLNYIYIRPGINLYFSSMVFSVFSYLFRPQFYIYFILGIFLKKYADFITQFPFKVNILLLTISLSFNIFLFYLNIDFNKNIITAISFIIQNLLFCFILLKYFSKVQTLKPSKIKNLISWIGRESLGVYLWHVLAIIIAKILFNNTMYYYICAVCIFLILLGIIFLLEKKKFINQYILGHK